MGFRLPESGVTRTLRAISGDVTFCYVRLWNASFVHVIICQMYLNFHALNLAKALVG